MALIRLELHEHPAAPQHEMRQKSVLDSGGTVVGTVANLYVDEGSRQLRFLDVVTSDFLVWKESTIWCPWKPSAIKIQDLSR